MSSPDHDFNPPRPPRAPRRVQQKPEQALQRACVQILTRHVPKPPEGPVWTAVNPVPAKSKAVAGVSKAMGLRAGWPDMLLVFNGRPILPEFKAGKGRLSDSQRELLPQIEQAGGAVYEIRSVDEFIDMLRVEQIPCNARGKG